MSIVSSAVIEDRAQLDGRRAIQERHTDQLGLAYDFAYLCESGAVASAQLAWHATQLASDLTAAEIAANVANAYLQIGPSTNYSTLAQYRAALRAAFQTATGWDVARLGKFLNGLGLTDAQLAALFGVGNPSAGLTAVKNKLAALASHYDTVAADVGV